jgi:hypothetical protein
MRVSAGQMMRADLFTAIRTKIRRDLHHFISKHAFYSTSAHALHAYETHAIIFMRFPLPILLQRSSSFILAARFSSSSPHWI